jgi:hypothetical protein
MQKFLIVNCKGISIELAIMQTHENLQRIHADPETKDLEIYSVNFVNTFEQPQRNTLDISPQANQPVIVYNCCVILVEPKRKPDIEAMFQEYMGKAMDLIYPKKESTDIVTGRPTRDEIHELQQAARVFCQHTNLDPIRHSKAHKNIGSYFQICKDCGAEVWSDANFVDAFPFADRTDRKDPAQEKMFIVPQDPTGDQLDAKQDQIDKEPEFFPDPE